MEKGQKVTEIISILKSPAKRPAAEPHYWQYCVNCGTQLDSRKCKLYCPKCGFYHSCSEP